MTLSFAMNKIHAVIGLNGSGKSSLLKVLSGQWVPSNGIVTYNGVSIHKLDPKLLSQTVAFVSNQSFIPFEYTVSEIVGMGLYSQNKYAKKTQCNESQYEIDNILKIVNALHLKNCFITEISQGERQRIMIGRALITGAPIIILDEPTANQDYQQKKYVWNLLRGLAKGGKLIVIATHDEIAEAFCDTVTLIHESCCLLVGEPSQVFKEFKKLDRNE